MPARLRVVIAVASFIIYASAVAALQQHRDNFFYAERVGMAAGVSHAVYQASLGKVYPEIQAQFLDLSVPTGAVLAKATQRASPPRDPVTAINDGNGLGFVVLASWAMRLFGPHLAALPLFMFGLMGVSAVAFLCRFTDDRSAVVTVTFFSLTLMLWTPLVWDPGVANQIPIGGIRYFSLAAIVPAFHVVLDLSDHEGQTAGANRLHAVLLAVQAVLLVLAILVRGSAVTIIGPIFLVGLLGVWRHRAKRAELRSLGRKAAVIAVVGAAFAGSLVVALPSRYVSDGRLTTVVWHRAIAGLGTNPTWPFGDDLQVTYDCTRDVPGGLVAGPADQNGGCIWWHWVRANDIPMEVAISGLYSGRYEAVMRDAFFNILRLYPGRVLATLFYYKPRLVVETIWQDLAPNPAAYSLIFNTVVLAGFVNYLGFLVITASFSTGATMLRLVGLGGLFGICTIPSYLVAWATLHTTADLLFYCFFCPGLVLGAVLRGMRTVVRRMSPAATTA